MSILRRSATYSIVPPIPEVFIEIESVKVQNSASQCRISWKLTQASFIPAAFRIERSINSGAFTEVQSTYSMPDPFTGYKYQGINRNFYYVDSGLSTAGTYQYRINSIYLSNTTTKMGTTYYVKNGGNNGNTGLSDAQAWATMAYANSVAFNTGDLVLFKRGSVWTESQITFNNGGTLNNPITWAAYSTGADPHLRLATASAYGFMLSNIAYRNFEFLKFSASVAVAAIICFRSTNAIRMCQHNKVLNCEVDVSNASTGAGGGIFMYHTVNTAPNGQNANYARTYHVEYPEVAYCHIHGTALRSSLRSHGCRKGAWYHNNFVDQGSAAITTSGGDGHVVEYNECVGGTYATHQGAGCKANSQIYWLNDHIYRRNLIYYMATTTLSVQSAKDSLTEYNTIYDKGTTFAGFYVWTDPDQDETESYWAEGGNVCRNNILVGGLATQGSIRLNIGHLETGGGNWYDHIDFYDNCIFESAGSIIELDNPSSKINSHALFLSNWNDKYPTDIHEDPLFDGVSTGDFISNNPNCINKGCFAGALLNIDIGFESGALDQWQWLWDEAGKSWYPPGMYTPDVTTIAEISAVDPLAGIYSCFLNAQVAYRSELWAKPWNESTCDWYTEYWMGVSYNLINHDQAPIPEWCAFLQIHTVGAEAGRNIVTLTIDGANWYGPSGIRIACCDIDNEPTVDPADWDVAYAIWNPGLAGQWKDTNLSAYCGRKLNIVLHFIISDLSDGILQVWIDGIKRVDFMGPNVLLYGSGGNPKTPKSAFQTGIYKENTYPSPQIQRSIKIDSWRFAGSNGSYALVNPGQDD